MKGRRGFTSKSRKDPHAYMKKSVLLIRSNPVNPDPPVEKMANELVALGYDVSILGWDRSDNYDKREESLTMANGIVQRITFGIKASFGAGFRGNFSPLLKFETRLKGWLKNEGTKFDAIHAFDFDTGFTAYRFCRRNSKVLIYHLLDYYIDAHSINNSLIATVVSCLEKKVINYADAVIICTEKRKAQIAGSHPKQLYVIHNTPDINQINKRHFLVNRESNRIKIVYVGILVESRLLKEITSVVVNNDSFEFHVGGFGLLEGFFEEISRNSTNVYYYGKLPYNETLALERDCDVMVAIYDPSIRNNQFAAPNKFYESLMLGKPIIMAKNTGFDDIIEKNRLGVLIDYSIDGVEKGLKEIQSLKNLWDEMSKKGQQLYCEQYSWEIMKERINNLYKGLV